MDTLSFNNPRKYTFRIVCPGSNYAQPHRTLEQARLVLGRGFENCPMAHIIEQFVDGVWITASSDDIVDP